MTKIIFDHAGKPSWVKLDTGKFIHFLGDFRGFDLPYTQSDLDWFRKPVERMNIER